MFNLDTIKDALNGATVWGLGAAVVAIIACAKLGALVNQVGLAKIVD